MRLYLLDLNRHMTETWEKTFNKTAPLITVREELIYNADEVNAWIRQMGR